jgi:hypothetical protein
LNQMGVASGLKAPVSTGFVCRCLARLDAALITAGFEGALKDACARRACSAPTRPRPLTTAEGCGNPHVYTVRTMRAYTGGGPDLMWYGAVSVGTKQQDSQASADGASNRVEGS